jgi:hypothetical protein
LPPAFEGRECTPVCKIQVPASHSSQPQRNLTSTRRYELRAALKRQRKMRVLFAPVEREPRFPIYFV